MARIYSEEEKRAYLDKYKVCGKTKTEYARENDIPEATFRAWLKEETIASYGLIEQTNGEVEKIKLEKPTIFVNNNIRIELKEGYNKEFLRNIIEVLINDPKTIK